WGGLPDPAFAISPDERWLAFESAGRLRLIDLEKGKEHAAITLHERPAEHHIIGDFFEPTYHVPKVRLDCWPRCRFSADSRWLGFVESCKIERDGRTGADLTPAQLCESGLKAIDVERGAVVWESVLGHDEVRVLAKSAQVVFLDGAGRLR